MAYALFDLTYMVARELGIVVEGVATSAGTTTTTYDITDLRDHYMDDYFNHGILWILYNAEDGGRPAGILSAPQGEWARVTGFKKSTGCLTHTALTTGTALLDRYAVMIPEYTKDNLVSNINAVLGDIPVEFHDDTTITTASGTTEYTLPTKLLDQNFEIWINTNDTTNDNYWIKMHDWYVEEEATGTAKKLIFRTQPPEPYHIRIRYWRPHVALNTVNAYMRESVDVNRVVYGAALRCLLWKKAQKSQVDPMLDVRIQEMMGRVEALKARYPNKQPSVKLATLGIIDNFGGYY